MISLSRGAERLLGTDGAPCELEGCDGLRGDSTSDRLELGASFGT
jgi:hypothetical protein